MIDGSQSRVPQTMQIALALCRGLDNGLRDGFAREGRLGGVTYQSASHVEGRSEYPRCFVVE